MNFFINHNQIEYEYIYINGSDVNHIKNVLRKNVGDILDVVDGEFKYKARIDSFTSEFIKCEIVERIDIQKDVFKLTIFQGLTKADKFEYIIQKCTELGVYRIVPSEMKRCVVKLDKKDKNKKTERWRKIAEVASKQSIRNDILRVDEIASFNDMCNMLKEFECVILAYEKEKDVTLKSVIREKLNSCKNVAVIIGPEGGIDDEEFEKLVELGAESVSLGKRILRTETAPVAISAIIMYEVES